MNPFADLEQGRCGDPFSVLGMHRLPSGSWVFRAFVPWAQAARISLEPGPEIPLDRVGDDGGWEATLPAQASGDDDSQAPLPYRLILTDGDGNDWPTDDPYRFLPSWDRDRVQGFLEGRERRAHQVLGAHPVTLGGVTGTRFAVWAPSARAVSLTGDMNGWDGRCHPMRRDEETGVWALFVPGVSAGARYKFQIVGASGVRVHKADPFARASELRPRSASVVAEEGSFEWHDAAWLSGREAGQAGEAAMSVYEVHLGSWRRGPDDTWLGYRELADTLLPYVRDLGFTHVELMPITEHPLDQSWGYQSVGYFCPTSRFGTADEFRAFVDRAHELGLGVLLDWVPGHFAPDGHGLLWFDGTPLFEPEDRRQARQPDWGTLAFDHRKPPVRSFLISSALRWIEDFHIDGLRIDAVAAMLYLDYSRGEGEWVPNEAGGNENLAAVAFLRELNDAVHQEVPSALTIAEESTAWPGVSHPTADGGLGFDQKWNMGWMNDTLAFMAEQPAHRPHHIGRLTFSIMYAWSEQFMLPLSHDEVVHGKGSLLNKMPGDADHKFANLRLLLAYQWLHPGKKLLFMGGELAQWAEWNADGQIDWALESFETHLGVRRLVRDLNTLYRREASLHRGDFSPAGFEWLDLEDPRQCPLSFLRRGPGGGDPTLVVLNFESGYREHCVLPVPSPGRYRVVLNTDASVYGGNGTIVPQTLESRPDPAGGRPHSVTLPVPGLSALVLEPVPAKSSRRKG